MRLATLLLAAAMLAGAVPAHAGWQDEISSYDRGRLLRLDQSRNEGLEEAARAAPADRAAIHEALDPPGGPISERALLGTWRCRQMKLGGLAPAIVYTWFTCRVRQTRNGLFFEKLTGTERYSGYLDPYENGRFVLLGSLSVGHAPRPPYSGGTRGIGAETTPSDVVGVVMSAGPGHVRIELPYPVIESTFDVIEMRR